MNFIKYMFSIFIFLGLNSIQATDWHDLDHYLNTRLNILPKSIFNDDESDQKSKDCIIKFLHLKTKGEIKYWMQHQVILICEGQKTIAASKIKDQLKIEWDQLGIPIDHETAKKYLEQLRRQDINPSLLNYLPNPQRLVIKRSFDQYCQKYPNRVCLVLFSGRQGRHSYTYGCTQGFENYMIDYCGQGEVDPDAALNIYNFKHMAYFPDESAHLIVADDSRFMGDEQISSVFRILKQGGKLAFKPGGGMGGWPNIQEWYPNSSSNDSGRVAFRSKSEVDEICRNNEKKRDFINAQLILANSYYKKMNFNKVEYDNGCFILIK